MHAARRLSTQNGLGNFLPLELRKVPGSPLCGQNDGEESNLCFFCPWLSWGPPWDRGPQWGGGPVPVGDMFSQRQTSKLPQALLSCLHGGSNAKTVPATRPSLRATLTGRWGHLAYLRRAETCQHLLGHHSTLEAGSTPCWGCVPAWLLPSWWDGSVWLSSKAWAMTYVKD